MRTVLVTGAYGFIGAQVAARLLGAGCIVRATGRDARRGRRIHPYWTWLEADFAGAPNWAEHLKGVDAVVNCVGVLQDGGMDSTRAAHVDGADALFAACERAGVRRVIQISAVGADGDTAYARTKREGDARLMARDLDWTILKPSLVIGRGAYGGTALIRGLAGIPFFTPVIASRAEFRPIHMDDLCDAIVKLLEPEAPVRTVIEAAGPEAATLEDILTAHRAWLGFGRAPIVHAPRWLANVAFALGDLAGRFGMRTALRSTSRAQMEHGVAGDPTDLPRQLGLKPRAYSSALAERPAGAPDRWHARLYLLRPIADLAIAAFWVLTGIVCLTSGRDEAIALAQAAGLGAMAPWAADVGGWFDIAMGGAYLLSGRKRRWLAAMAAVTLGYVAVLSVALPWLWADPLGRLMKLIPFGALLMLRAAMDDPR